MNNKIDYKSKYEKYRKKCNDMIFELQNGGKTKHLEKLFNLKEKLKEKGLSYWFDKDGRVLAKHTKKQESVNAFIKKIKKNPDLYFDTVVANVDINFLPDEINNKEKGGLEIDIEIVIVKKVGNSVAFNLRNNDDSLLRLYYRGDELHKFKMDHLKKLTLAMINKQIKNVSPFKFYHLENFKDVLNGE